MKKYRLIAVLFGFLVIGFIYYYSRPPLYVEEAGAAALLDAGSGEVLFQQDAHKQMYPGSLTKIMVLLLIHDEVNQSKLSWDQRITVSQKAAEVEGSKVGLQPGDELSTGDLVKCVVIASGNDAAMALGEHVAGNEDAFVRRMNQKALKLGMKDTRFVNLPGLDDEKHYCSAYDIALMARELIRLYPDILSVSSLQETEVVRWNRGQALSMKLHSTNSLLAFYRGCNGLKTGSTPEAGYCLCATARRDGKELIAVVMGANSIREREIAAVKMFDYGRKIILRK